jgi:hypothetical protein
MRKGRSEEVGYCSHSCNPFVELILFGPSDVDISVADKNILDNEVAISVDSGDYHSHTC